MQRTLEISILTICFFHSVISGDEYPVVVVPGTPRQGGHVAIHASENSHEDLSSHEGQWPGPNGVHNNDHNRNHDKSTGPNLVPVAGQTLEKRGFPPGCVDSDYENCNYMVIIKKDAQNGRVHFKLSGKVDGYKGGYVAVGLSEDKLMGDDHIVECILRPNADRPSVAHSWSIFHKTPLRLKDDSHLVHVNKLHYENGVVTCEFDRPIVSDVEHFDPQQDGKRYVTKFDMYAKRYTILLATGSLKSPKLNDDIGYHGDVREGHAYVSEGNTYYYSGSSSFTTHFPVIFTLIPFTAAMLLRMLI